MVDERVKGSVKESDVAEKEVRGEAATTTTTIRKERPNPPWSVSHHGHLVSSATFSFGLAYTCYGAMVSFPHPLLRPPLCFRPRLTCQISHREAVGVGTAGIQNQTIAARSLAHFPIFRLSPRVGTATGTAEPAPWTRQPLKLSKTHFLFHSHTTRPGNPTNGMSWPCMRYAKFMHAYEWHRCSMPIICARRYNKPHRLLTSPRH